MHPPKSDPNTSGSNGSRSNGSESNESDKSTKSLKGASGFYKFKKLILLADDNFKPISLISKLNCSKEGKKARPIRRPFDKRRCSPISEQPEFEFQEQLKCAINGMCWPLEWLRLTRTVCLTLSFTWCLSHAVSHTVFLALVHLSHSKGETLHQRRQINQVVLANGQRTFRCDLR